MKLNILKSALLLALCGTQLQAAAGRIYDEYEDISKITWIGNYKQVAGGTDDWANRAGDIYRLALENKDCWAYAVYDTPGLAEIIHSVVLDFYAPTGWRPTLAVKNAAGVETKYLLEWANGYPEVIDKGNGIYRFILKDDIIPDDAVEACVYLDGGSDNELLRTIVYYGDDEYKTPEYNENANYFRAKKLIEKAEAGEDLTIGVIGGSMTAGANAEPMATNCYGARIKAWFEENYSVNVNFINIGIGSTNSYFGGIRAEEKLLRFNPDLVVCEYAANDQLDPEYLEFYEGLLRKCYKAPGEPAVVSLMLCTQAGISRFERQIPIAQHNQIPVVSYVDVVKDEIVAGEKSWLDYYQTTTLAGGDGIHPNTAAHQKIADLVCAELLKGKTIESEALNMLPTPMYSANFEDAYYMNETMINPVKIGNWIDGGTIWDFGTGKGWRAEKAGDELQFNINGDVAAVTYWRRPTAENFGKALVWVDDNEAEGVIADASNGEAIDQVVLTGLGADNHVLHIKLLEDKKFEVVTIAVSGQRSYWNKSVNMVNFDNGLYVGFENDLQMASEKRIIVLTQTPDGYITMSSSLGSDAQWMTIDAATGTLGVTRNSTEAAKFLFVDNGEGVGFRAVANGKYLTQNDNVLSATAAELNANSLFTIAINTTTTDISDVTENGGADVRVMSGNVVVSNAEGLLVNVYDMTGKNVYQAQAAESPVVIELEKGCYLVKVSEKTVKCLI